jgi:hypothetical protein
MKAAKTTRRAILLAAAVIGLSACTNPIFDLLGADNWGLVGTWVNSNYISYDGPGRCYKLTVRNDGTFSSQDPLGTSGGQYDEGTYTVQSVSVSGNSRTFQVHYSWDGIEHNYVLTRVTDGTSYESVFGIGGYPATILITDSTFNQYTLQ